MSNLTQELLDRGFTAKLSFVNDSATKILVVSNRSDENKRYSLLGDLGIPTIPLKHNNPSLKNVTDGVRFHLGKLVK